MRKVILTGLLFVLILALAAFGWLRRASGDLRKFDGAELHVTVSGAPATCSLSRRGGKSENVMSCANVAAFFRDELQLPQGVKYYVVDSGNSHREEINALVSAMKASGYPPIGVMAVFISEPGV